jgi:hypothetical protein
MAIFIVDQFSLNTDLPLDIRYIPAGGSYLDVSAYWYPGMQVYQTDDQKIWYADNSLNWHQVGSGDASIGELYQFFNDLSTYVYQQIPAINASIAALRAMDASLDASINVLFGWQLSQDASISALRSQDASLDASINLLFGWQLSQDASIVALRGTDLSLDASIQLINAYQLSQDASIVALRGTDLSLDASIQLINAYQLSQDASISALRSKDASLDASIGLLNNWDISQDASIAALRSKDASLDASIGLLNNWQISQDASIAELRAKDASIDASLGLFVAKAGDTMTGPLTITAGGLVVNPGDVSIFGGLYVQQNTAIGGDLTINGSLYVVNVGTLDVSTGFIRLNTGLTGAPPVTLQSGIVIERGSSEPYVILYDESDQTFRIGIAQETSTGYLDPSTQAVATRQDAPIDGGIAYWNDTLGRFDTSVGFTLSDVKDHFVALDASIVLLYGWDLAQDASIIQLRTDIGDVSTRLSWINISDISSGMANLETSVGVLDILTQKHDTSIGFLTNWELSQDASIVILRAKDASQDASIAGLDLRLAEAEVSINYLDSSIQQLFQRKDTSVLGAINIGDGSAQVYAGLTADGSLQFRELVGSGAAVVSQSGDLIVISLDASFAGEVNTASNIAGGDASIFLQKIAQDLQFRSFKSLDPSSLIITNDASFVYIDLSIGSISAEASLGGLTDVSITAPLQTHQIVEYDGSVSVWKNTNNIWWDTSLATTSDDLGGIPQGTDLIGLTLKEILFRILYEYQAPNLYVGSDPIGGIYEKGLVSTQFASIDVSYFANNFSYPLAKLNNFSITKTGTGTLLDVSLGLIDSCVGTYTDGTGITNWGGTSRTINYNVYVTDDQPGKPSVMDQESFTFYYRQYWGTVDGNTIPGQVNSAMILTLDSSRLAGETDLAATFDNPGTGFIKYLFAYPDTVASPDNFGVLSQIIDQNGFEISDSFNTENEDVSVGLNNVRYRFYLLKNKVDTSTFDITFKF